jgi:mRNA interferase HicA
MKRKELVRILEQNGWILKREGGNHSVYTKGKMKEYVPRHREIDEQMAKSIIKRHGLK